MLHSLSSPYLAWQREGSDTTPARRVAVGFTSVQQTRPFLMLSIQVFGVEEMNPELEFRSA